MTIVRPARRSPSAVAAFAAADAEWYRDAIIYELHVRAFADGDNDGAGDFIGLTGKLDYLQDLGVTAIWLLPFYESPLRDDGYDIADYRKIHPAYGTMRDFQLFLDAAHRRGLRVITELVLNHTSDQHAWFQRARHAPPGSSERDFYVWSDTGTEFPAARVIFKDFEPSNWAWDPVAGQYFWHRFYSHQPDLNFDNPRVRREILDVVDFWLDKGVDGFRLDAVPYLFEREGTVCENLPETHDFLRELRAHVDSKYPGRMLLAEANQWPEDAAIYLGAGDECHMAYHFPLMPRLFMSVRMEDRFPITEILEQTPAIPESCQWALFLRNHDELTLEMVTDEERDYMYRVYAGDDRARVNLGIRRRLAPLLGHNRRLMELMNALLLSMKGTPVVYYGDEIGMGDNIYLGDRNGVRTPMQWNADRNAGFSKANPQRLYLPVIIDPEYHYEAVNVESQQQNPSLLLWWMKRIIALRKRYSAFGRGSMTFVDSDNRRVLAYLREHGDQRLLIVANLSRFAQGAQLNLPGLAGHVPMELFGQNRFPAITDAPYFLSLGPHSFYWFELQPPESARGGGTISPLALRADGGWEEVLEPGKRAPFEQLLAGYLAARRWFPSRPRGIRAVHIEDIAWLKRRRPPRSAVLLLRVEYAEGEPEHYALPVAAISSEDAAALERDAPWAVIGAVDTGDGTRRTIVDGVAINAVATAFLECFRQRATIAASLGVLQFTTSARLSNGMQAHALAPPGDHGEKLMATAAFGSSYVLKFVRRAEYGEQPPVELSRASGEAPLPMLPRVTGLISYRTRVGREATLGILETYVPHQLDAWNLALDELRRLLEENAAERPALPPVPRDAHLLDLGEPPQALAERAATWLDFAGVLGTRTGELHLALERLGSSPAFAPEPFASFSQRALHQALRVRARQGLRVLRAEMGLFEEATQVLASQVVEAEEQILARLRAVGTRPLHSLRMRGHGNLHLRQALVSGRDPVFIDFESEPGRTIGERRVKRSPLTDVASMIRSFHYAARRALVELPAGVLESSPSGQLEAWAHAWYLWSAAGYLKNYLSAVDGAAFLVRAPEEELRILLDVFILDKALDELVYEIGNRPDWVTIPLRGLLDTLEQGAPA